MGSGTAGLSILEMVIETTKGIQRLNGNVADPQMRDEIVWTLNKAQDRFVSSKIKPAGPNLTTFQVDAVALSDLSNVIQSKNIVPDINAAADVASIFLPPKEEYLLSAEASIVELCNVPTGTSTALEVFTEYTAIIPFKKTAKESVSPSEKYYTELKFIINHALGATTAVDISTTDAAGGLDSADMYYVIRDYILDAVNQSSDSNDVELYWENYKDSYAKDSFIAVSSSSGKSFQLKVDGKTTTVAAAAVTTNHYPSLASYVKKVPVRIYKTDYKYNALRSHYHKSTERSLLGWVENGKLYISFHSERFLVNEVSLSFIRRPRRMSLSLRQHCELNSSTHNKVCDLANEILREETNNPSYQTKVQDNEIRME